MRILAKLLFCAVCFSGGVTYGVMSAEAQTMEPAPKAVQCSAAFQIMKRVSTRFAEQPHVEEASTAWTNKLVHLAKSENTSAKVQLTREMQVMANAAVEDPTIISDIAMQCIADAPNS